MKNIPKIAGALLGLAFIVFGLNHFFQFFAVGGNGKPSPEAMSFFSATGKGFMSYVKVFEIIGGILVTIPLTRNWGLLILGPILINIIAVNVFIMGGNSVFQAPIIGLCALAAYLLWDARHKFCALIDCCAPKHSQD